MKYQSILQEIKEYSELKSIFIDRNSIMNSLGIDLENGKFIDLSNMHTEELNDIIMKSLGWMERLNEILATSKKIYLDLGLEADRVFNNAIRKSTTSKVADAKAVAKTSEEYIKHQKQVNLMDAYVDYLERLIKNIEKIHYAVKGRLDAVKGVEIKHYAS
jgi:hypothetical protein